MMIFSTTFYALFFACQWEEVKMLRKKIQKKKNFKEERN